MAGPTCDKCRFWHTTDGGVEDQTCRRFPPVVVSEMFEDRPLPAPAAGVWPVTDRHDWCGEWAAKDE